MKNFEIGGNLKILSQAVPLCEPLSTSASQLPAFISTGQQRWRFVNLPV
jgi:hypothetical protein